MAKNKVIYFGETLIDLTGVTAQAGDIQKGKVIVGRDGLPLTGTAEPLEYITSFTKQTIKLSDTDFASWTPSTTAKAIIAAANVGTFIAEDIMDFDYWTRTRVLFDGVYPDGTSTGKGMLKKCVAENWYVITRRPSSNTYLNNGNRNSNIAEAVTNQYATQYYNSGWVAAYGASYGIYTANAAPTLSSTSSESPTVTFKNPIINARCSTTYFSTGFAGKLDQDKSTITLVFDVYRSNRGYMRKLIYDSLIDIWNNGL